MSCAASMTASQSEDIVLSGEMAWRTSSTRISPPPPGMLSSPAALRRRRTSSRGRRLTLTTCWISGGEKACTCRRGNVSLNERRRSSYHSSGRSGWWPPCMRMPVPPRARVSSIFANSDSFECR